MALAVVTATKLRAASGNSVTGAITAPSAGNLLYASFADWSGSGGTSTHANHAVSDNVNGAWTKLQGADEVTTGTDENNASTWYRANTAGGAMNVTLNVGGGTGNSIVGLIYEVSGADTASPSDGNATVAQGGPTSSPATNAYSNAAADAIYFAHITTANGGTATLTKDAAWSRHANAVETDGTQYTTGATEYLIVASSSSRSHTWTTTSIDSIRFLNVFKAAGGGATLRRYTLTTLGIG